MTWRAAGGRGGARCRRGGRARCRADDVAGRADAGGSAAEVSLYPQTLLASSVHPSIQILGASERGERGIRNEMAAVARVFRGSRFLMSPAPGAAAAAKKAAAPQVTKADATAAKEKRGILKPVPVSEEMRRFAGGKPEVARSEAVKLIWAHIKANGLQV